MVVERDAFEQVALVGRVNPRVTVSCLDTLKPIPVDPQKRAGTTGRYFVGHGKSFHSHYTECSGASRSAALVEDAVVEQNLHVVVELTVVSSNKFFCFQCDLAVRQASFENGKYDVGDYVVAAPSWDA